VLSAMPYYRQDRRLLGPPVPFVFVVPRVVEGTVSVMDETSKANTDPVIRYYQGLESRLGYRLFLHGEKHLGWHPHGQPLDDSAARKLMTYRVLDNLNLRRPSQAHLLDAGCGLGAPSRLIAKLGPRVDGISIVPFEVATAVRHQTRDTQYHLMSYQDMSFRDGTFDGVYTLETLSHATDIRRALQEMFRVLKPGGRLSLCEYTMAPDSAFDQTSKHASDLAIAVGSLSAMSHLRHGTFNELLSSAGFSDIVVETHTKEVLPSLRRLHKWSKLPASLFERAGLSDKFGNTMVAESWFRLFESDLWRFVTVTAAKPAQ
jgi:sterol 24-C-methyltransferase